MHKENKLTPLFVIQEIELAQERMSRAGRVPEGKPYTAKVILGYFTSWKTVLFTLIFSKLLSPFDMMMF